MVSIEVAEETIISSLEALPVERVAVTEALGRILRADVVFTEDMPAFPASLKDGYALVSSGGSNTDTDKVLRIREDLASHAGTPHTADTPEPLKEGEAAYIATGAPVPTGADAVAMIEVCDASAADGTVKLVSADWPEAGTDIRRVGSDAQKGDLLLEKDSRIMPGEIGLLIAAGITHVQVTRQVRIGVLSTGDELVDDNSDGPLTKGLVRDANRPMLLALIKSYLSGLAIGVDIGIVRDDESEVEEKLRSAYESVDLLITSGGVSMGAKDYLKSKIGELNTIHFGRINMKPGKPLTFASQGKSKGTVALPGNPVSSFVCFHVAAKLAARVLAGIHVENVRNKHVSVVLGHEFARDKIRPEFQRATVEWCDNSNEYIATSTGKQGSSRLASVRAASALVLLPNGTSKVAKDARAKALLL